MANVSDPDNKPEPTREEKIRQRAYEIWVKRNADGIPGDMAADWQEALQQIEAEEEKGE